MSLDKNKVNKNTKPNDEDEDYDLDFDLDSDDFDEDEDDLGVPNKAPKSIKKNQSSGMDKKTKYIIFGASAVAILAVAIVAATTISSKQRQADSQKQIAELQQQQQLEQASKQQQATETPSDVKAGAPNLQVDNQKVNDTPVTDESKITSDLNGNELNTNYKIKSINTVRDFINFKKYRAQTADGMEFYWLEVTYKEKPYKVQVPYKIFKELDDSGITVADIEVTKVDKGGGQSGEVVTYMNIVENSKKLINQDKN